MAKKSQDSIIFALDVFVFEGSKLPKMDRVGRSPGHAADPYVLTKLGTQSHKTKTISHNQNPIWNENFKILVTESSKNQPLHFEVYDWDRLTKDEIIGSAEVEISKLPVGKTFDQRLVLKHKGKERGELHVSIIPKDFQVVEKEFWTSFANHFDYDNSKTVSLLELHAMLEAIESSASEDETQQFFNEIDKDKDGEISFDDFVESMRYNEVHKKNPLYNKVIPEGTVNFIWNVFSKLEDDSSIGTIMLERGFYGKIQVEKKPGKADKILVFNRETKKKEEEKIPEYIHLSLKMMYASRSGRFGLQAIQLDTVLKHLTEQQGKKMNSPKSASHIKDFIQFHNLNTQEIKNDLDSFKTFNEFFYRQLKEGARVIAEPNNPNVAISPADCRLNVFETVNDATKIWIKGKEFTIPALFRNDDLAKRFDDCHMVIARLAPQDYHRFHVPVNCTIKERREIPGRYLTVNPIAINNEVDVYTENHRAVTVLESEEFGEIVYITVGATLVGSIFFTAEIGTKLKKGDEYGYFAFGGSTVLLFFKKDTIKFDEDLIVHSREPIETLVKMGSSLGKKK